MTTHSGVNDSLSIDEATTALLGRWEDAEKPSDTDEGEPSKDADDGDEDVTDLDLVGEIESEDETDEGEDASDEDQSTDAEDEDAEALEATDDHKVSVTVDGETKTVTVKELKRLFGQEASLTRKSQEVASTRKAVDAEGERYMLASQALISRAEERFRPFEKIDWMVAQQKLSTDEFVALREEAKEAHQELTFLRAETDDVLTNLRQERQTALAEAAKETIAVLERDIPGWNKEVYDNVRSFATKTGMDAEVVSQIVDPAALKMMHMAMRYAALKEKAATKKPTKATTAPKRVVKPSGRSPSATLGKVDKGADALARLSKSGSRDDAAAAFLARWSKDAE